MDANVVSLRGEPVESDRRAEFLRRVGESFDDYARRNGQEPEAVVYALCGLKQPVSASWIVTGESEGGARSVLALATMGIQWEAMT